MKGIITPYISSESAFDEYTQWLQSKGEVWPITANIYMVTSYRYIKEVLSDEEVYSPNNIEQKLEKAIHSMQDEQLRTTQSFLKSWLSWQKGEAHSLWKKNLLQNFHSINDLSAIVDRSAQELIDSFFSKSHSDTDLVNELVDPFISKVILRTLNYNEDCHINIREWNLQIRQILDPVWGEQSITSTHNGLANLTSTIRSGMVLGSNFLDKTFEEMELQDLDFLYGNLQFFILAGVETSIYFLARAILILVESGLYLTIDWENSREVKTVVEELLRYISPSVFLQRETTQAVTLGEAELPENSVLMLNLSSANRDPSVFETPFQLNFQRSHYNHIAFGYKKHICFGKALSLLEINRFLPLFFLRLRQYSQVQILSAEYEKVALLRGLKSLRVRLCP